jgi:tripartite-type tricarboxylate transporter receptor subunit TctC
MARLIGEWLSERLGQQFIVDDRLGAASNIGTEMVAKAPPDGYTLLMAVSTNAVKASFYTNLNFSFIRDFAAVGSIGGTTFCNGVQSIVPGQNLPGVHRLCQG